MKFYDISREIFSSSVYPGDPIPYLDRIRRIEQGDEYNLSAFFTGCHSGTHLDAPLHFLEDGSSAAQIPLEYCFGPCSVVTVSGWLTGSDMEALIPKCEKRILLKGNGDAFLTESAAQVLADYEISLVGTDASSIAIPEDEAAPHIALLSAGIPILEGLVLSEVPDGTYLLCAFPLKMEGAEGGLCRAVLIDNI